jgi:general secretion pathway protein G
MNTAQRLATLPLRRLRRGRDQSRIGNRESKIRRARRSSAFTLVELLTVIAIIGILAAIIIPTVGKVRRTARRVQSISNLRGIASATLLYVNEHKDAFPYAASNAEGGGVKEPAGWQSLSWGEAIEPWLPAKEARWATTSKQAGTWKRSPALIDPLVPDGKHHDWGDYGANMRVFRQPWNGEEAFRLSALSRPSRTILAMAATSGGDTGTWYLNNDYANGNDTAFGLPADRGAGVYFCAFGDGHAKTLPVGEFSTPTKRKDVLHP